MRWKRPWPDFFNILLSWLEIHLTGKAHRDMNMSGNIAHLPSLPPRKKIWELEHRHHCSIVGTCLTLTELRRFCRKAGVKASGTGSDYNLHITLVSIIGSNPGAARPVNKHLDRKYSSVIRRFAAAATPEDQERLWREAVSLGEIAGAYWALVTHPLASEQLLFQIYGEVHMLSHLSGASVRLDMQALNRLRRRVPELERRLAACKAELLQRMQEKERTIQDLRKRLESQRETVQTLARTQQKLREIESGEAFRKLHHRLEESRERLDETTLRAARAEAAAEKWQKRALELETSRPIDAKSRGSRSTSNPPAEARSSAGRSPCGDGDCVEQNSDLCRRCILYVGGRNRQRARFRTLVERQNGYFIHHDGGLEESSHRLAELLPKADVVLCPLDCISHDAVQRIVRHCRKHGKRLKFLPKSSLAAFSRGLDELFANE